jgi:membrane protein
LPTLPAASDPETVERTIVGRLVWSGTTAYSGYVGDRCPQIAAAISYHVLFALVPLFTFLGTILGLVLQDERRQEQLTEWLVEQFPLSSATGVDISRILADIPTPVSVIGLVSVLALVWSASGMTAAVRVGVTAAIDGAFRRPYFHSKLVDVLLVLAVASLFIVSFGLSIVVNAVERWSDTLAESLGEVGLARGSLLGYVVPIAIVFGVLLLLYRLVPRRRLPFRALWIGALFGALASEAIKVGFSYYLSTIARYDLLYGSLGSVFAFLLVVYLQASVLLFGAELASAWPKSAVQEEETAGPPLGRRVLLSARGLFIRR